MIKQIEYRKSKTLEGPEIYRPLADADVGKWHLADTERFLGPMSAMRSRAGQHERETVVGARGPPSNSEEPCDDLECYCTPSPWKLKFHRLTKALPQAQTRGHRWHWEHSCLSLRTSAQLVSLQIDLAPKTGRPRRETAGVFLCTGTYAVFAVQRFQNRAV